MLKFHIQGSFFGLSNVKCEEVTNCRG